MVGGGACNRASPRAAALSGSARQLLILWVYALLLPITIKLCLSMRSGFPFSFVFFAFILCIHIVQKKFCTSPPVRFKNSSHLLWKKTLNLKYCVRRRLCIMVVFPSLVCWEYSSIECWEILITLPGNHLGWFFVFCWLNSLIVFIEFMTLAAVRRHKNRQDLKNRFHKD